MRTSYDVVAVLPFYHPETTSHCQSWNSLLPFLAANGLSTAVVTSRRMYSARADRLPKRDEHEGVAVYRFGLPNFSRNSVGSILLQSVVISVQTVLRLLRFRTRIVFCMTTPPLLFAVVAALCRMRGIPLVLWAMDLHPDALVGCGLLRRNGVLHRVARRVAAFGYRRCETIFTLGPVMSRRIQELGVPEDKLVAVHNWVPESLNYVPRARNPLAQELGLGGRFVVLYSGNMGFVHSFDVLLQAARKLADADPEVLFLLIGNGPERKTIESFAEANQLKNIRVMDYVPIERLSESLSCADLSFVSFRPGMEGAIAPGRIYAFLRVGGAVVLVESRESDLSRILHDDVEGAIVAPDDVDGFVRYVVELKADPKRLELARKRNSGWYQRNCSLPTNAGPILGTFQRLAGPGPGGVTR